MAVHARGGVREGIVDEADRTVDAAVVGAVMSSTGRLSRTRPQAAIASTAAVPSEGGDHS